ncbi:optineurin-like isoform X2 [Scleropages formosus]|uniref:optineurin-like isoform X2 n=1 Tax=Scleropages formosus TaxID=113540 RepID=UPI0008784192|nr:optineurin-like isoform X2 [Scleropages formosus]
MRRESGSCPMASNSCPTVNGKVAAQDAQGGSAVRPSAHMGSLEETLHQMNILIKENRDLKEALKHTNFAMKERFEGLSAWKEKQKEERDFLEGKLEEAKKHVTVLNKQNEELRVKLLTLEEKTGGSAQGEASSQNSELEVLKAQIARLQAEKNDLVALNSELQLKMGQGSPEDSFIEIRIAEGEVNLTKDFPSIQKETSASSLPKCNMTASCLQSEELTVSKLLQSLRKEVQKVEKLELELQAARERPSDPGVRIRKNAETQTSLLMPERDCSAALVAETAVYECDGKTQHAARAVENEPATEVESLKAQMMTLFKDLQQAQSNLNNAEEMKKTLQERCRELEQDRTMLRTQLVEKHHVQELNERLKLQMESIESVNKIEHKRAEDDRKNLAQLRDAYTKLFEDYNEMKEQRKKNQLVSKEELGELQSRLSAAEQALVAKQLQIDEMKQEIFKKEQELETLSVFQAQAEVYSSDFYAERAAREKIHEEKERLAAQLEFVKKQNSQLQEEMDSLGRKTLNEMQRRHVSRGASPHGAVSHNLPVSRGPEGRDWQQQVKIPEHACPKCNEILPDLDSLQIHIMDCII